MTLMMIDRGKGEFCPNDVRRIWPKTVKSLAK